MQRARAYLCYDRANGPQDNRALPSFPEHSRLSPHARNACGRVRWPGSNQNHKAYGWARCAPRRIPSAQLHHGTHRRPPCVRPPPLTHRKGQGSASSKEVKWLPGGPRTAASPRGRGTRIWARWGLSRAPRVQSPAASTSGSHRGESWSTAASRRCPRQPHRCRPLPRIPRELHPARGGRSLARDHRTGTALRAGAASVRAHGPCFEYSGFSDGDELSGRPGIRRAVRACASEAKWRVLRGAFNSP